MLVFEISSPENIYCSQVSLLLCLRMQIYYYRLRTVTVTVAVIVSVLLAYSLSPNS